MVAYKKDQGRYTRMACFWVLLLVVLAGLYRFRFWLDSLKVDFFKTPFFPGHIPLVLLPFTPSVLICYILLPLGTALLFYRFFNRPKVADFLIETEAELKKCTWPTLPETWTASVVVVVTVLIVGVFLALSDNVLGRIFNLIIFLGK